MRLRGATDLPWSHYCHGGVIAMLAQAPVDVFAQRCFTKTFF